MKKILILKHVPQEGPGTIGARLRERGVGCVTVELGQGEHCPESLDGYAGLVVMGGPMNVYEETQFPFLANEDRLIKQALQAQVPFLGICLGAQLLAKAAGARVYKAPIEEIGWFVVSLTTAGAANPLFRGVDRNLMVFQWHGDTFDVPAGGQLLATATQCPAQAFKTGPVAYGLQFHVETDSGIINEWLADQTVSLTAAAKDQIRGAALVHGRQMQKTAETITNNFIECLR
jgi:GMP synthase-like glutamine amidotransferase